MKAFAAWCLRHRRLVVAVWVAVVVVLFAGARITGQNFRVQEALGGTDSQDAFNLLRHEFPAASGDVDRIVWRPHSGKVDTPAVRRQIEPVLARIARLPHVVRVVSPYHPPPGTPPQISRDGRIAFATVTFDEIAPQLPHAAVNSFVETARAADTKTLQVELSGEAVELTERANLGRAEGVGLVAAGIILLLAFGSLLGMLLPLITAVLALGTALPAITLLTHVMPVPQFAPELGALIGLGVGLDYALFIVTRHRTSMLSGHPVEESIVTAMNTSGRAVVFAGSTVCIAVLGMFVLHVAFLYGVAIAACFAVVATVAAAMTLLPALLGFLGPKVLSKRERRRLRIVGPEPEELSRGWERWARWVNRHPSVLTGVALAAMVALLAPSVSMRLASSDQGNDPTSFTTRRAYDLLVQGFGPGFNGPLLIAAETRRPGDVKVFATLLHEISTSPDVAAVGPPVPSPNGHAVIADVYPASSPQSVATAHLLDRIRHTLAPPVEEQSGLVVHVGGVTALFTDFAHVLSQKLPYFIAIVVALSFLLLMVAFRSIAVPATGALMNLLSAGAAFGVITAIFQWGWISVGRTGPIEAFLPVMMFAILFGLSMDYQVFLVSRMHEEWIHTADNDTAITRGQAETGRVITAAALIMVAVFVAFVAGGQRPIQEFAVGMAAAVALDALVVRTVLVPAAMHLLGQWNWWLPRRLDKKLPHLSIEPPEVLEEAAEELVAAGSDR